MSQATVRSGKRVAFYVAAVIAVIGYSFSPLVYDASARTIITSFIRLGGVVAVYVAYRIVKSYRQ